jgi:hypothetical protein
MLLGVIVQILPWLSTLSFLVRRYDYRLSLAVDPDIDTHLALYAHLFL